MGQIPRSTERISSYFYCMLALVYTLVLHFLPVLFVRTDFIIIQLFIALKWPTVS